MTLPDAGMPSVESMALPDNLSEILARHTQAHSIGARITHDRLNGEAFSKIKQWSTPRWLEKLVQIPRSGLEHIARPTFLLSKKRKSFYNLFGISGMLVTGILALGLTYARGLSIPVTLALLLLALLISIAHVILTIKLTGNDRLVFLRYFLSIMAVSALFLHLLNRPVIPYLEVIALGLGGMQCLGRIGCFMAGCCHGRPHRLGVAYQQRQLTAGFSKYLIGVRLIPVQLIESAWIGFSVLAGLIHVLIDSMPGVGLGTYLVLFSAGRFFLEMLRGDRLRTYRAGLSEAQWLSALIIALTVAMEWLGIVPYQHWHLFVLGTVVMFILISNRKQTPSSGISLPAYIYELARVFNTFEQGRKMPRASNNPVHLQKTSSGIQVSETQTDLPDTIIKLNSFSHTANKLTPGTAAQFASLILGWRPYKEKATLIVDNASVYHLIRYREEP